jgi:hypothetical protein
MSNLQFCDLLRLPDDVYREAKRRLDAVGIAAEK